METSGYAENEPRSGTLLPESNTALELPPEDSERASWSAPQSPPRERRPLRPVTVSTVIPVYRGAAYLRALTARLATVREVWEREASPLTLAEMIFVDDGSADSSGDVLAELREEYPWLRVITLSRNFGQHPATIAGILHSSGDWVATLDEDLQHPPEHLETLLREAVMSSVDVVYARPRTGPHGSPFRDWSSSLFKRIAVVATRNPYVRSFSSFRMVRGEIARAAAAVSARNTYFDVALCWFTNKVREVPMHLIDERFQTSGQSGYRLLSLLRHARRLLVSSEMRFAKFALALGAGTSLLSVVAGIVILLIKLISPETILLQGWTSVILTVLFFGGLSSGMTGVVIEYVSLLLVQALGQPMFFVIDRSRDRELAEYFRKDDER